MTFSALSVHETGLGFQTRGAAVLAKILSEPLEGQKVVKTSWLYKGSKLKSEMIQLFLFHFYDPFLFKNCPYMEIFTEKAPPPPPFIWHPRVGKHWLFQCHNKLGLFLMVANKLSILAL